MTNRFFAWAAICLSLLLASAISGAPASQELSSTRSAIDQYCVGCHTDKLKTGGLKQTPLQVAEGVRVGLNFRSHAASAEAIREILNAAGKRE